MKIAELQKKLIAAGRTLPVDDRVPYAFEKRVMARLRAARPADGWSAWARGLWQAAVPCVGLAVALCALSFSSGTDADGSSQASLSEQFETAVYAAMDYPEGSW